MSNPETFLLLTIDWWDWIMLIVSHPEKVSFFVVSLKALHDKHSPRDHLLQRRSLREATPVIDHKLYKLIVSHPGLSFLIITLKALYNKYPSRNHCCCYLMHQNPKWLKARIKVQQFFHSLESATYSSPALCPT